MKMPIKSAERRNAIKAIRKKGNFVLKQEKNILVPVRKPPSESLLTDQNYFVCPSCLGFYKKKYLWRHKKNCGSKLTNVSANHLSESQTFIASTGILGNYINKSRIKKEIFSIMRPDLISEIAKTDPLIVMFGESCLNKHKRKQMNVAISNKLRELARLKIVLKKTTEFTNYIEILKPEMYNVIIAASKIVSGFDAEKKTFRAGSLALHLGTTLKFLCDIAKKAVITKDPLIKMDESKESKLKSISELKELLSNHWCNDVSSLANKDINEKRNEKPKLLPVTRDVQLFSKYVNTLADIAFDKLKRKEDVASNYKVLVECTFSIVLIFNRKRIGEVQFLDVDSYERNISNTGQEESLETLSELERAMCATFKRVIVFGKGSKPVPLLFTKKMQKFINILLHTRKTTDIVPKENKYIFANPDAKNRWISGAAVLRKFAKDCGASNPELLTSTRFRKQIATILQLMNFEKNEMEQIARFMGHTEKTHLEFYRYLNINIL